MRRPLSKALVTAFASALGARFPQFERRKLSTVPKSTSVFEWRFAPTLWFFIVLNRAEKYDEFCIELAWSEHCRFPNVLPDSPKEKPRQKDERLVRLSLFITRQDRWWQLAPRETSEELFEQIISGIYHEFPLAQAIAQIQPQVSDAIEKISKYAIPYFKKVAEEHGYIFGSSD